MAGLPRFRGPSPLSARQGMRLPGSSLSASQSLHPPGSSLSASQGPRFPASRRLSKAIVHHMQQFVGTDESEKQANKWDNRLKRYAQTMGDLKPQFSDTHFLDSTGQSQSRSAMLPQCRKQSVAYMAMTGLGHALQKRPKHVQQRPGAGPPGSQVPRASTSGKRGLGAGVLGSILQQRMLKPALTRQVKAQLDNLDDHRPYFTYWVTFVQLLVFVVAAAVYGVAPYGLGVSIERRTVKLSSLAREVKEYKEHKNLWFGPRQADLIHLGARYSPCMRVDLNLKAMVMKDRRIENSSACCVRNDGDGCVQRVVDKCDMLSTVIKWTHKEPGPKGRLSGSVCGQDPSYCTDPASVSPFEWPDSIVDWPLCKTTQTQNRSSQEKHMSCELLGRPCCFGILGECWITTKEHCDLIRGRFHPDKYLCAQAPCFEQMCGMFPFSDSNKPDQVYRLWTSLFLHAGVLHLMATLVFQMWIMRDIEKLTGALRISIIYLGSGIAGNLAGSTFIPYIVDAGPSGAQFGVMACLLVEVIQSYQMFSNPYKTLLKMFAIFMALFALGMLPWFDNWSHLFGFFIGFLLAFGLIPYVSFGKFDRRRKTMSVVISLGVAIGFFIILFLSFYLAPIRECRFCKYVSCIPFTATFCKNMDVSLSNRSRYDNSF